MKIWIKSGITKGIPVELIDEKSENDGDINDLTLH
jgi:hypothetical protein